MTPDPIPTLISQVDADRIRTDIFYLAQDPLPHRKLNSTLPGHEKCTLYEADEFIQGKLQSWGYAVEKDDTQVQAFRRDETKNIHHQYSTPEPDDPWYAAHNIYAKKTGAARPDEIIVLIAHKDSQSWIDSPGANDNAVGTVGNMEIARVLAEYESQRSIWFIWCNEEHTPWTSVTAAKAARDRGDNIIALFNTDGIGRGSPEDKEARRLTNWTAFTEPEGERIADLMAQVNEAYDIGLIQSKVKRERPGDDDGSYINAGFPAAVINIGSYPYKDPNYHLPTDTAETVDVQSATMAAQAIVAAVVTIDRRGL